MAASQSSRAADLFAPRNFLLAGLGLASIVRRESGGFAHAAIGEGQRLGRDAIALAGDARDVARGIGLTVAERIGPIAAACAVQVEAAAVPLLSRFGIILPRAGQEPAKRAGKTVPRKRGSAKVRKSAVR